LLPIIHKPSCITRLILSLFLLLAVSSVEAGTLSVVGQQRWVQIVHVHDGDSLRTAKGEKIRLLGINTPEISNNSEPGQIMGDEAKQRLTELVDGQLVQLQFDKEKQDVYGRTLAQVYLRNGTWVNAQMVREGLAHVYTFAPNFRWASKLIKAENEARNNKRGIWDTKRFRILKSKSVSKRHIGQFRVVVGTVSAVQKWKFRLDQLRVSIPRKYRQWFKNEHIAHNGKKVIIRGMIRQSSKGQLYLALHSPADLE
jgi:endonuclease YncB( thermonuclease family)